MLEILASFWNFVISLVIGFGFVIGCLIALVVAVFILAAIIVIPVIAILKLVDRVKDTRWYRRRSMRKWRPRMRLFDQYEIRRSEHLFGFRYGDGYVSSYMPLAESPEMAIARYLHRYEALYHEKPEKSAWLLHRSTARWATYKVTNLKTETATYFE